MMPAVKALYVFLFLICLLTLHTACKSTKKLATEPIIEQTDRQLYQVIADRNFDYEWFVAKGKAQIESPTENVKTTCYIRIKKDSLIWMAFKKLSIEAVRAQITPDSFYIAYRPDSQYERGSMEEIRAAMDIDISFSEMQDYLVGLFPVVDSSSIKVDRQANDYILTGVKNDLTVSTWIDARELLPTKLVARDAANRVITASYEDYQKTNKDKSTAFLRKIITDQGDGQQSSIKFDFSEILIDVPKATKFNIPSYYQEINTRSKP